MTHKRKALKREGLFVRVDPKVRQLLDAIKERDGVPYGAQLERAIVLWAQSKGIEVRL
jgi:hypothetical protein